MVQEDEEEGRRSLDKSDRRGELDGGYAFQQITYDSLQLIFNLKNEL